MSGLPLNQLLWQALALRFSIPIHFKHLGSISAHRSDDECPNLLNTIIVELNSKFMDVSGVYSIWQEYQMPV